MGTKWVPIIDKLNRYKIGTKIGIRKQYVIGTSHWYEKWVPNQYQKCAHEIGIKWVLEMGEKWVPIIDNTNQYKMGTRHWYKKCCTKKVPKMCTRNL